MARARSCPQDPLRRYSNAAVTFHWMTVVLVLLQVWLGFSFADMAQGPERVEPVHLAQDDRRDRSCS